MVKRLDRVALIISILALLQPVFWIVIFLLFNFAQGEMIEEIIGGFFLGCIFSFILSVFSLISIFVYNRHTCGGKYAFIAKKISVVGIILFPIILIMWIVANCYS